jgi:hypothetical protein
MDTSPAACEFYGRVPNGMYCGRRNILFGIGGRPAKRTSSIPPGHERLLLSENQECLIRPVNNRGFMPKGQSGYWVDPQVYTLFKKEEDFCTTPMMFFWKLQRFKRQQVAQLNPAIKVTIQETENFRSNQGPPRLTYFLLGGYLFFDVNPDSLSELGSLCGFDQWFKFEDKELKCAFYALYDIVQSPKKRGILMYRSAPHESTEGNAVTHMSLVEKVNNQKVKSIETLVKKAKEQTGKNFLIIRCSMPGSISQTICVDKRKLTQDATFFEENLGIQSVEGI